MRAWVLLLIAGLLETGWAVGLKYTEAFTRFWPSVWTLLALVGSMVLLGIAVRDLPIGTAYPVWVGIGAVGAALYGILVLGEAVSPWRMMFLVLLVVSIVGLKWSAGSLPDEQNAAKTPAIPEASTSTDLDSAG
jgi:quaternary ammonium compound-resistance protein SugE